MTPRDLTAHTGQPVRLGREGGWNVYEKPYLNVAALRAIQAKRIDLGIRKNHDYSGVVDAIAICGVSGLATRIFDKAARLLSLSQIGHTAAVDESIADLFSDLGNYADYGASLCEGTWGVRPVLLGGEDKPSLSDIKPMVQP